MEVARFCRRSSTRGSTRPSCSTEMIHVPTDMTLNVDVCEVLLLFVPALASNLLMIWYIMMEMENSKDPEESEEME